MAQNNDTRKTPDQQRPHQNPSAKPAPDKIPQGGDKQQGGQYDQDRQQQGQDKQDKQRNPQQGGQQQGGGDTSRQR